MLFDHRVKLSLFNTQIREKFEFRTLAVSVANSHIGQATYFLKHRLIYVIPMYLKFCLTKDAFKNYSTLS